MKFLIAPLLLLCTPLLLAQKSGLILDDQAYEQTPLVEKPDERGNLRTKVDLRPYCPKPGDQGGLPSCVAWTLANALTIKKTIKQRQKDPEEIEKMRYSVSYIYNQIAYQGDCEGGATFTDGFELLRTRGDCPATSLTYSLDCNPNPEIQHHTEAFPHRIQEHRRLFSLDADKDEKIDNILDELNRFRPVLVGVNIPLDFRFNIPQPKAEWSAAEGHAMVVVGYNEYSKTFILMNSYGTDWGEGGFFEMDWDTLGEQVLYGYVMLK